MKSQRGGLSRWARASATATVVLQLAACGAAPTEHFYRLDSALLPVTPSQAVPARATAEHDQSIAMPVPDIRIVVAAVPESIDRPQLVLQRDANEVVVLDTARWAEPVRGGIARILAEDLAREFPQAWIRSDTASGGARGLTLVVAVEAMDCAAGEARLQAQWRILAAGATAPLPAQRLALRRSGVAVGSAAAVAAWSTELAELAHEMARSIREASSGP